MYITLEEMKEMVRRMNNAGADRIYIDTHVNCDTAEVEEMHFDSMDGDLYLDTIWSYYLDENT